MSVFEWREKTRTLIKEFRDELHGDTFEFTEEVKEIDKDEKNIQDLLKKYGAAKITKLQLLDQFDLDQVNA